MEIKELRGGKDQWKKWISASPVNAQGHGRAQNKENQNAGTLPRAHVLQVVLNPPTHTSSQHHNGGNHSPTSCLK